LTNNCVFYLFIVVGHKESPEKNLNFKSLFSFILNCMVANISGTRPLNF
jgi:hypothetical protein